MTKDSPAPPIFVFFECFVGDTPSSDFRVVRVFRGSIHRPFDHRLNRLNG